MVSGTPQATQLGVSDNSFWYRFKFKSQFSHRALAVNIEALRETSSS